MRMIVFYIHVVSANLGLCNESVGSDNVQLGDTKDAVRVVHAALLEDLGGDGNCGIHLETNGKSPHMEDTLLTCHKT